MKVLVLGGSYFYGRVFVMQAAKEHEITVVNRGTYSMESFGVKQIIGNRKDAALWKNCREDYDVLVDFCGYNSGDIKTVLDNLAGNINQYLFISTVDVYERGKAFGEEALKGENTPYEKRTFAGEAGSYIAGKVALEQELVAECGKRGIAYTVLRPAVLYGPFNYAPRESVYIQMLVQNHILPQITDAAGKFQFVYVKDAALAAEKCLLNADAYGQAYNLCGDAILDYNIFFQALEKAADVPFEVIPMTAEQALAQNIPLPFPLTREETELYSNEKSKAELKLCYTELAEGMLKTYRAFKNVYA